MDDANIPNLTTLPYIDWCSAFDPTYLATRAFVLSTDNPFYFSGRYAQGLGSPHTPYGYVWPLGIIGRALTATSSLGGRRRDHDAGRNRRRERIDSRELLSRWLLALHASRVWLGQRARRRALFSQPGGRASDAVCLGWPNPALPAPLSNADVRPGLHADRETRRNASLARSDASARYAARREIAEPDAGRQGCHLWTRAIIVIRR